MGEILLIVFSWAAIIIGVPVIVYRAMKPSAYRLLVAFIAGAVLFVLTDLFGFWLATHGR